MTMTNTIETAIFIVGCSCLVVSQALSSESPVPGLDRQTMTIEETSERNVQLNLSAGWSSKYVTEGIDCLPGSGIWEVAPSINYGNFTLSAWYAGGVSETYDELDLVFGYAWQVGEWTINPWYEHQFYFEQDYNVNNPALTVSRAINGWLKAGAETQVKIEHKVGEAYYSVFLQATWEPVQNVTISPLVRYGYNGGYNTAVADGSNSIDYSLNIDWKYAKDCTLGGSVNYSQAVSSLRRAGLGDVFWFGIRAGFQF